MGLFPLEKATKDKSEKMLRTWYSVFKQSCLVFRCPLKKKNCDELCLSHPGDVTLALPKQHQAAKMAPAFQEPLGKPITISRQQGGAGALGWNHWTHGGIVNVITRFTISWVLPGALCHADPLTILWKRIILIFREEDTESLSKANWLTLDHFKKIPHVKT